MFSVSTTQVDDCIPYENNFISSDNVEEKLSSFVKFSACAAYSLETKKRTI